MNGDVVRCNYCGAIFTDDEIVTRGEDEYCPRCGDTGGITDLPSERG